MKAELEAIAARLKAANAPTVVEAYLISAPLDKLPPYYVLEPVAPSDEDLDRRLAPGDPGLAFPLRVKSVGGSGQTALNLARVAKEDLSPDGAPTTVAATGRRAEVWHDRFEAAYPDDSVTLPNTNRHPAIVVEAYGVSSQPTA